MRERRGERESEKGGEFVSSAEEKSELRRVRMCGRRSAFVGADSWHCNAHMEQATRLSHQLVGFCLVLSKSLTASLHFIRHCVLQVLRMACCKCNKL